MNLTLDQIPDDLWIFAYGSLMWRPGFPFLERAPARVVGLHRSLCVYSFFYRGTPEKPGLVLGLDRGGACRGIAFRVAPEERIKTIAYLREREQVTAVYLERLRDIHLMDSTPRRVRALTYIADRSHPQYAGKLTLEQRLHLIRQGHGHGGPNRDYVLSTVAELDAHGYRDKDLDLVVDLLRSA